MKEKVYSEKPEPAQDDVSPEFGQEFVDEFDGEEDDVTYVLDLSFDQEIAQEVIPAIREDGGYSANQAIPGLVRAILLLAEETASPEQALDEAMALLDEGIYAEE